MVTEVVWFLLMILLCRTEAAKKLPSGKIVTSITRHYQGDVYTLSGVGGCGCGEGGGVATVGPGEACQCQCVPNTPTFRDDAAQCVSTLHECSLADFVSSSGSEKIPYVYMPLKHQLVHPTAEVALLGLAHGGSPLMSPVCVVTKGSILTQDGWENMANTSTFEPPFRLFRDGGRTYVQWVGEEVARVSAEGRLVLVTLICRDAAQPNTPVFRPCLAFRVAGSPGVSEAALFAPVRTGSSDEGLSSGEGIIIGLVVTCLAIMYVVGMTIYIKLKRRKKRERNLAKLSEEGLRKSKGHRGRDKRPPHPTPKPSLVSSSDELDEDIEDLSYASRTRRAEREKAHVSFTTVVVHNTGTRSCSNYGSVGHDVSDGIERAPRSPLAVVETLGDAGPSDSGARALAVLSPEEGTEAVTGDVQEAQAKRKLYFNPAYFEPEMLQSPPPAALEFLTRIREMINIAKSKMKSKTYQPSLGDIPEEDSEGQSRPISRATGRSSRITLPADDLEKHDEGGINQGDVNTQSDSLEHSRDSDSRSSTLRRLARRVNSHGESFVSEIIKTLDLKPKLPIPDNGIYNAHSQKAPAPKPPPPKPVNARNDSPVEAEEDFPELIKPSMLRSVLRDGKRLTELNNTFENFRQEMMATFHRMKKVGEAISPMSTLSRTKNKNKSSPANTLEKRKSEFSNNEGKVHKWLQTLENKNSYTRMSENQNVIFDSKTAISDDIPPPLPEKYTKPPTPPRKHRALACRSVSFNEMKEPSSVLSSVGNTSCKNSNDGRTRQTSGKVQVTRSLSWQSEHRHYDSNPRQPSQQASAVPEEGLNTSFGSEDDSLNDLLSEAESKVPKMTHSDSDSTYSDTRSRYKDSLEPGIDDNEMNSKSLSRQLPREEEITARNEVFNKKTGTKTMSCLIKNSESPYERARDGENTNDNHTYEEIHFPAGGKHREKRKAPQRPSENNSKVSETQSAERKGSNEEDNFCSIYSNPDSLASEVTIEKSNSPIYSGCKVTIPVVNNMGLDHQETTAGFDQDTLEKRGKKVDRNGSFIQDSLERPKTKKRNNNKNENTDGTKTQRKMCLPSETFQNPDKSLLDIYESRSSTRSLRSSRNESPERTCSPVRVSNPPSPIKIGSFYLNNISSSMNSTNNIIGNNNDTQKKYITFKDYQEMRFQQGSFDSDISSSPLPVTGTSINFNFCSSSPLNKDQKDIRPPLPPKQTRTHETTGNSSPNLPPKSRNIPPPLPLKANKKSDFPVSETDRPKLPEKSRKKSTRDIPLSPSPSGSSIPELTEEEARSILHGLLAHTVQDPHRLSPLHEEDDIENNFLGVGNTAADSDSRASVPCLDAYSSGSLETPISSSSSSPRCDIIEQERKAVGEGMDTNLYLKNLNIEERLDDPGSPGSDARVSGQFILSTIGRSLSLRRQPSLNREQTNGFLAKLRNINDVNTDNEAVSKGMEVALALNAKSDLEQHFKDKSGADSIKRTWRKIIEKVDDSKEENDKISIMKFQQYMVSLDRKEREKKLKQEDSGYHSTDSSESANSRTSQTSVLSTAISSASTSVPSLTPGLTGRHQPRHNNSLNRPHFLQRSTSMYQLNSFVSPEPSSCYWSGSFQRASLRASLSRRFNQAETSGGLSVYINNCFTPDDDVHVSFPL
ncbi:serine-rich adhesin for platelets isoform X1 [Cherax quadricarinatus]|uniref:serine-rich adhesin for platelets isoform X1 n=2 Tax=Cherax quadricarinatus TaxID=27406 RepID=UPI00387E7974